MLIIWPSLGGKDKGWERTRMSTEWKTNHAVIWPPHTSSVRNKSSQQLFLLNGPVWQRSMCESKPKSCLYEQPPISPFVSVTQWFCRQSFRGIWALRCWVKVWKAFSHWFRKDFRPGRGRNRTWKFTQRFLRLVFFGDFLLRSTLGWAARGREGLGKEREEWRIVA